MVLDTFAALLLMALWLLGGAAFFDNTQTEYKNVLIGWSALNGLVIAVCLIFWAVLWALERLYT